MECGYCDYFDKGKRKRVFDGKDTKYYRFCIQKDEWIQRGDLWCEDIKVAQYFYCDTWDNFVSHIVCLARQRNSHKSYYKDCKKCTQGEDIKYLVSKLGLSISKPKTLLKPQLIKRKKPILIKRKKPQLIKRKKPQLIKRKKPQLIKRKK